MQTGFQAENSDPWIWQLHYVDHHVREPIKAKY